MNIEQILTQLGFSQNEISVYLACLDMYKGSAQDIAKRAAVPRTTAYSVLRKLIRRNLISKTLEKNKTRYIVEDPQKLQTLVDEVGAELNNRMEELRERYVGEQTKPRVTIHEGVDAVGRVLNDTLYSKPSEILEWNTNQFFNYDRYKIDRSYISKRVALGISAKRIAPDGSHWEDVHKIKDTEELSETRIIPESVFGPDIEVNIYNNKVAFISYTESMSLIIESPPIANAMRQVYNLTWDQAGEYDAE